MLQRHQRQTRLLQEDTQVERGVWHTLRVEFAVSQNADKDPAIRVFPQTPRFGDKTWALWLFDHDYVVILAERSTYYLLKTAFVVNSHKQQELERDWQASQKPPKS
jgi:hypothetical protein